MLSFTGVQVRVQGALHNNMLGTNILRKGTGCTIIEFPSDPNLDPIILVVPCGLYTADSQQHESLFHTHQACSTGLIVDNCASVHQHLNSLHGTWAIHFNHHSIPFDFDGTKCFWRIQRPTATNKATLQ